MKSISFVCNETIGTITLEDNVYKVSVHSPKTRRGSTTWVYDMFQAVSQCHSSMKTINLANDWDTVPQLQFKKELWSQYLNSYSVVRM